MQLHDGSLPVTARSTTSSGGQEGPSDADVLFDLPEPDDTFIDYGEPDLDPSGGNVLEEMAANLQPGEAEQISAPA